MNKKCENCGHRIELYKGMWMHYSEDSMKLSDVCLGDNYECKCINPKPSQNQSNTEVKMTPKEKAMEYLKRKMSSGDLTLFEDWFKEAIDIALQEQKKLFDKAILELRSYSGVKLRKEIMKKEKELGL